MTRLYHSFFMNVCMLFMNVALLNDNSLKHIYTLSIICASFTDPVFLRVFRSVYYSLYHIYIIGICQSQKTRDLHPLCSVCCGCDDQFGSVSPYHTWNM